MCMSLVIWYGMADSCMYLIRSVHECISPHDAQKLGLNHKATDLREFGPSLLLTPSLHIKVVKKKKQMCLKEPPTSNYFSH
jgi:hypothetical protein